MKEIFLNCEKFCKKTPIRLLKQKLKKKPLLDWVVSEGLFEKVTHLKERIISQERR